MRSTSPCARHLLALGLLTATVTMLTGCTPQQPHDVTLPELVWDAGIAPSSPLESHPDVIFARKASLAQAYAVTTGDFAFIFLVNDYPPPREVAAGYEVHDPERR